MKLNYFSSAPGIGGTIKNAAEDFLVEEIIPGGEVLEHDKRFSRDDSSDGRFLHFILQKKNWTSEGAIKEIAKKMRVSFRSFNFAGSKDKIAITTQRVSCFGIGKEQIERIMIKDIKILGAWTGKDKIDLGELLGNRFTVKVKDCGKDADKKIKKIYSELSGKFPNYFGEQRFGSTRRNTHVIGEKMMHNDYEAAAMEFLCSSKGEEHHDAKIARKELENSRDYASALKNFPHHLKLERSMLAVLEKNSNDYINAFRALPRSTLLMFVHAFQSHLFNISLSQRIAEKNIKPEEGEYFCGEDNYGFPDLEKKSASGWLVGELIGYETKPNEREKGILNENNITPDHFKLRRLPEISSAGALRTLFAPLKDFSFQADTFKFSLQSGSYATVAVREFIDKK